MILESPLIEVCLCVKEFACVAPGIMARYEISSPRGRFQGKIHEIHTHLGGVCGCDYWKSASHEVEQVKSCQPFGMLKYFI